MADDLAPTTSIRPEARPESPGAIRTSLRPRPRPEDLQGPTCTTCSSADEEQRRRKEDAAAQQAKVDAMTAEMSPQARAEIAKSPTLQRDLATLHDQGTIVHVGEEHFGPQGFGPGYRGYIDAAGQNIYVRDPNDTFGLSHEVKHGLNTASGTFAPQFAQDGLNEQQWTQRYVDAIAADEASSFAYPEVIRGEILSNGGRDLAAEFGSQYGGGLPTWSSQEAHYRQSLQGEATNIWNNAYGGN